MALLIILIALGIQRLLQFSSEPYQLDWANGYYSWCVKKIEYVTKGHGLLGFAILVIPILFVVSIVMSIIYHLLGFVGYYIVSLVIVWYSINGVDPARQAITNNEALLEQNFKMLFARIFWYVVFGTIGLVLYYIVCCFNDVLAGRQNNESKELSHYSQKVLAIFDWIPVRLYAFSFALVGHFPAVFKEWMGCVLSGLEATASIIKKCAQPVVKSKDEAVSLLNRVLVVWLVVIALVTLGVLLG